MKIDNIFDLPCECGCCDPEMVFECAGCLRDTIPYCMGGSEELYSDFCTLCWNILVTEDMNGPVIQVERPNVYMNY